MAASQGVIAGLRDLRLRRVVDVLLQRADDLTRLLDSPAYWAEYPGRTVPQILTATFGPIGMRTPRRSGVVGFVGKATVVTPQTPEAPRGTHPQVSREGPFHWCSWNATAWLQWSYVSTPGYAAPLDARPLGDLLDPVFEKNGGGQLLCNYATTTEAAGSIAYPRLCFELELYDRKRGRLITEGRLPAEQALGLAYGWRPVPGGPVVLEEDTDLEVRPYVTEMGLTGDVDADAAYDPSRAAAYLQIAFKGYRTLPPLGDGGRA